VVGYRSLLVAALATLLACDAPAQSPQWDVEIDPAAYALHGYSLHVGLNSGHMRYELGAYAADVPRWMHGNKGFDASMRGVGAKLHYYFGETHEAWFAGIGFGPSRERIEHRASSDTTTRTLYGAGVEAGYRFRLGGGFYATPWAGLEYLPRARDVTLDGERYADKRVLPFAAVHVGYAF
jgi:hypothetical protein